MDWVLPWDTSNLAGCWVFPFQAAPILLLPEATSGLISRPQGRWWPGVPLETSSFVLLWHSTWALCAGPVWVSLQQEEPAPRGCVLSFQLKGLARGQIWQWGFRGSYLCVWGRWGGKL